MALSEEQLIDTFLNKAYFEDSRNESNCACESDADAATMDYSASETADSEDYTMENASTDSSTGSSMGASTENASTGSFDSQATQTTILGFMKVINARQIDGPAENSKWYPLYNSLYSEVHILKTVFVMISYDHHRGIIETLENIMLSICQAETMSQVQSYIDALLKLRYLMNEAICELLKKTPHVSHICN